MSLKDTYKQLRELLAEITLDLEKSENGNKAAAQRVRTGTVKMEKIAKLFRKESIASEKKNKGQKRPSKSASGSSKGSKSSASSKGKSSAASKGGKASGGSKSKTSSVKAKPKAKSAQTSFRSRSMSVKKRATAKLPTRRVGHR